MTETDNRHFLFLARKLRERAEEGRTLAETFRDPDAHRMMLEIAERYERLAQRLENVKENLLLSVSPQDRG